MTQQPPANRSGPDKPVRAAQHGTYPHDADAAQPSVLLTAPREGTPAPIETTDALEHATKRLVSGTGPLAVDAERASGYRYSHRAYLIQLRRAGAGTFLVDPIAFDDLQPMGRALQDTEWVLHAASQDLPCLTDVGMRPTQLFDTELGARLAGFERVGLAALTERLLGYTLEKHHSAADWSNRPLPASWLTYAALDVELLIELRYALGTELERQGKLGWAQEEFAALLTAPGPKPRTDPWRRTSGIHKARGVRALARVRALWQTRDDIARKRDVAPGRILPDAAIMAAAQADPADAAALTALPGFGGRATRKLANVWLRALTDARLLPDSGLPSATVPSDGPPPPHRWAERDPAAAARLARCRTAVNTLSEEYAVPPENLILPDSVRRLAWTPPESLTEDAVADELAGYGARQWQITLTAGPLAKALAVPPE
ncbi:MAG: HRDC domain-containing protein [Micromonosporaceae bacterium]